jgi:DNA polymerase elongation subunit (family B)
MNYEAIYTSISYVIGSLYCFAKKHMNGTVVPTYTDPDKISSGSYEGAFVFDVEPGFFKDGIMVVDFNSLYPNTIRANNISPETYVGKVISCDGGTIFEPLMLKDVLDDTSLEIQNASGKIISITGKKLKDLVKTKVIFTTNNTMFLKPSIKKGLLNQWSEYYFNRRKEIKKLMAKAHKAKDKIKEELYNNIQHAIKIFLNTLYGVTGTRFSPIGNPDIAQTITRQGKFCNINANKHIGRRFKDKFNIGEKYKLTAGGDTDSVTYDTKVDVCMC